MAKTLAEGMEYALPWDTGGCIEMQDMLLSGDNDIQWKVTGFPRNTLDPFHLREKPCSISDGSFCPPPEQDCPKYLLSRQGVFHRYDLANDSK